MKTFFPRIILLAILTAGTACISFSQNLTGIWRGYFITENNDQYKFELQLLQNKSNVISGVSYSYEGTVFYGKATLTGMFDKATKNALIQEIKTVELRMLPGSVGCIMKCSFQYVKSGREEFLDGTFTSTFEKTNALLGVTRGGDCGGGRVYLRKVATSDFYIEPFLRNQNITKTLPRTIPAKPKAVPNIADKKPVTAAPKKEQPSIKPIVPENEREEPKIAVPPVKVQGTEVPVIKEKIAEKIPEVIKNRENPLIKTIYGDTEEVTVKFYDSGIMDGDTISVYLNNKIVLSKQLLTASPLTIKLKLDKDIPEHELIMVAENLGSRPPNTALMIVNAGDKRYEVRITSTEQKNAVVRFVYRKPK